MTTIEEANARGRQLEKRVMAANRNNFDGLTLIHGNWLAKMGYNKATPLEALALVTSEIGEAVNECRHGQPSDHFGEELADIVLRVMGIASQHKIDLLGEIYSKIQRNLESGDNRGRII